jgi:alpha-glucosidase (family GH31 glycosyl hydrolase)
LRRTGAPIVRPLWFTDPRLQGATRAFTLGSDVLVAPIFGPRLARTRVTLPRGRWVHVWSGRTYRGRRTVTVASPLGRPAVFTRPGGPLRRVIISAAEG